MKKNILQFASAALFILLIMAASKTDQKQQHASIDQEEEAAVKSAILDYVEGIYDVDSTRIERSVHPELRKRGYWYDKKKSVYHDNLDMTYEQLVSLAAKWNKSGKRANADSPKQIDIYDVNDRTASAKLTAAWGIDYFHLAKMDDKWMIVNVLWQSLPPKQ